jgi:hypothetical protein
MYHPQNKATCATMLIPLNQAWLDGCCELGRPWRNVQGGAVDERGGVVWEGMKNEKEV